MFPSLMLALAPLVPAGGDFDPPFSLAKPPAEAERLMARLNSGERLAKDEAEVAKRDCFRPYFPLLVLKDVGLKEGMARTVFVDFYLARHKARLEGWAKGGRLDLIAESQVVCARGDDGLAPRFAAEWSPVLADLVGTRAAAAVRAKVKDDKERLADVDGRFESLDTGAFARLGKLLKNHRFDQTAAAPVVSFDQYKPGKEPDGVIDLKNALGGTACFADRAELVMSFQQGGFFVVGGDVWVDRTGKKWAGTPDFSDSLFVANGNVDCGQLEASVVIADGDARLVMVRNSSYVLIARGNISVEEKIRAEDNVECDRSLLVAGGKITGKSLSGGGMLLAKGGLELSAEKESKKPDKWREKCVILDGTGPADLGVRWFELGDVGLEVAADGKTAVVKGVAEKSPFKNHLQPKDVLREVNAVPVATPDAARRALRRAYILGFAVVTFDRDGKTTSKLVPIDDLMEPAAKK